MEFLKAIGRYLSHRYFLNKGARISFHAKVSKDSQVGQGSVVFDNVRLGSVIVGTNTYISENSIFERTTIGNFCSIATGVRCGMAEHPINYISTYPGFYSRNAAGANWFGFEHHFEEFSNVYIGSDVWIGTNAIILAGVSIGTGSIIAAGAVVTKDVPPFSIVGGVPAKVIKYRFDEVLASKILESKWWDLPLSKLDNLAQFANNPVVFLEELKEKKI